MAFTGDIVKIGLRYIYLGQRCQTERTYRGEGATYYAADPTQVGEAWWNDVKAAWRGLANSSFGPVFESVYVEEVGGALSYGEYSIPSAERTGTRAPGTLGDALPSYVACGVRLSVATRLTRPGQMRLPFVCDDDTQANALKAGYLALAATLAAKYSSVITLGAPVALATLAPLVVKYTQTVPPAVAADQEIVGYVLNGNVTSQVSRRPGHGP